MGLKPRFALAVDDEPAYLEHVCRVLAGAGYSVFKADNARTAMEIFQALAASVEVLVTDVAMSPVNGSDLAALLVKLKPDLHVIFVSAYSAFRYHGAPLSSFAFLAKPFSAQDLLEKIRPEKGKVRSAGSTLSD